MDVAVAHVYLECFHTMRPTCACLLVHFVLLLATFVCLHVVGGGIPPAFGRVVSWCAHPRCINPMGSSPLNSIAFGSAPRREAVSQLDRPAVSQTETHTLGFLSVADMGPSSGENSWLQLAVAEW